MFKLEIKLGNDSLTDSDQLAILLEGLAETFRYGSIPFISGENGIVRDWCGNTVGEWEINHHE